MKTFLSVVLLVFSLTLNAQLYPSPEWSRAQPAKYGFDAKKLEAAKRFIVDSTVATGCMVVVGGESIFEYGSVTRISYIASCRKSVLAMMYGKWVENGTIDLSRTIGDLGLDDVGGLLPIEKRATIDHLITARSGVYHDASNGGDDAANRPPRGTKEPGTYFLYNNWDFNAAGAVFEKLTGQDIYRAFQAQIAFPIGLQDWDLAIHRKSGNLNASIYPAYHFNFSTRDMARIGYLMLRNGKWNSEQVISREWVAKILSVVTPLEEVPPARLNMFEYGYMWWLFKVADPAFAGAYSARGAMGQFITVLPALDMVVAFKTDSVYERTTSWNQYYTLLQKIAAARL